MRPVLLVWALSFLLVGVLAHASGASASCNPGRPPGIPNNPEQRQFDGWKNSLVSGASLYDTRAYISEYSPYVPDPNYPTAQWVMLARPAQGWLGQIGWVQGPYPGPVISHKMFVEAFWNGAHSFFTFPASSTTWTQYEVKYFPGPGSFSYYANGQLMFNTWALNGAPYEAQQFAELLNNANQVPGGFNNHSLFTESFFTQSSGQNYYFNAPGRPATILDSPDVNWAAHNPYNVWQLDVWDTACAN